MNIILIGMAGCGKSCMGRSLSSKLKIKNLDVDKLIEKNMNMKLNEIIQTHGVDEFRKIEENTLLTLDVDNMIISTGGSAVYYESAMQHLKSIGKIVYLYVSLETLTARVGDFKKRGMVMRDDQTIADVYNERVSLYQKYADITVDCNGNAYPKYRDIIINKVKKYL